MSAQPVAEIVPDAQPYREGLSLGRLRYQHCRQCGHRWLSMAQACPRCLSTEHDWKDSAGRGHVVSWIVYHTAYDPSVEGRVPYDVTIVELDEGFRVISNIVNGNGGKAISWHAKVVLAVELQDGQPIARFKLEKE